MAVAGGISDKDAAEHAFSLGADAVQAATRFVTTWECDADLSYKQSYLNAKKEDVILVKVRLECREGQLRIHLSVM